MSLDEDRRRIVGSNRARGVTAGERGLGGMLRDLKAAQSDIAAEEA